MKDLPVPNVLPRWYQDLSIPQMRNVFALGDIMRVDNDERVTGRTQRALSDIGVTSTFVKLTSKQIKQFRRRTDLDPVKFLCEIYRLIGGKYFVDEEYKKEYDCNERIVLSAIAFLTLPQIIIELHRRLPMPEVPKFPPKPVLTSIRPRKLGKSPYLEQLCAGPDWLTYRKELEIWKKQCQKIPIPRTIMPNRSKSSAIREVRTPENIEKVNAATIKPFESNHEEKTDKNEDNIRAARNENPMRVVHENGFIDKTRESAEKINSLKLTERRLVPKPYEEKILKNEKNVSKRERAAPKSWLGEKDTRLIIGGSIGNDDSPDCPVSFETIGLAYVTPYNSDESFFAALSRENAGRRTYPRGREHLSRNWQEWLRNADEDYAKIEKDADELIKSVEKTLKLMGPEAACDSCCACRQTRKANIKYHETKTAHMVIDTIAMDEKKNKYVVGALAMASPAPSPSDSTEDVPEVIASHDKIIKNRIVGGVINEKGETTYSVCGISENVEHVPRKIVDYGLPLKPVKNVPPCGCAIEKTINEGLATVSSDDNIPWTVNKKQCVGKKYRPLEGGASSCREYPNDGSCRRNPFKKKIDEETRATLRRKDVPRTDDYSRAGERNMYSIADFQPCGDGDGMAVCGGPWGAVNIPDEEELARRAAEEKMILQSPPCGDKPGRAICGAAFGARHPIPKKPKKNDDDDEDDADEEEEEEKKAKVRTAEAKPAEIKYMKKPNRDPLCRAISAMNSTTGKLEDTAGLSSERKQLRSKIRNDKKATKLTAGKKMPKIQYDGDVKNNDDRRSSLSLKNRGEIKTKLGPTNTEDEQRLDEDAKIAGRRKIKEIRDQWNRMKKLMSKFATTTAILPVEPPRTCKREVGPKCDGEFAKNAKPSEAPTKEGPFGWRTKSEQKLPPEKTLVYLVDPEQPVETIPVRIGGKPCECRENRNAKKMLLYGVSGIARDGREKRGENLTPVIDGLIYITPTPSVRNSEEYIPEYELYDSPYEKCVTERKDNNFPYVERYLGPKSLVAKNFRNQSPCGCSIAKDKKFDVYDNHESMENLTESTEKDCSTDSAGKIRKSGSHGADSIEFDSRDRDNVPCRFSCAEFSKNGNRVYPKMLQVKKPVCECKYERKIVRREEEKKNWSNRQKRLKSEKKMPYSQVDGLSRPVRTESNFVISEVTRFHREDDDVDDVEYCLTGITHDRVMGPADCILAGIGMHTPVITPEPSKREIKIMKDHRHWSPMNIHARLSPTNVRTAQLRSSNRENPKNDDETDRKVVAEHRKPQKFESTENRGKDSRNDRGRNLTVRKEDKKNEKLASASGTVQRSKEFPLNHSVRATLKKKSPTEFLEEVNETNARNKNSANHIIENEEKAASSSGTEENIHRGGIKQLLKAELEKMSNEGYIFAQLPGCWQIPQLQWWLMYRKGIAMPPEERKKLMEETTKIWSSAEKRSSKKIQPPTFDVPQEITDKWNFDEAEEIKRAIELKKQMFQSNVRKLRVLQARNMWGLMEFGKFPGISFKRAYFTYQPGKESDGFVFKPWKNE